MILLNKNPLLLALWLEVFSIILSIFSLIFFSFDSVLGWYVNTSTLIRIITSSIMLIIPCLLLGYLYSKNYKEIMPNPLRISTATLYLLIDLLLVEKFLSKLILEKIKTVQTIGTFWQALLVPISLIIIINFLLYLGGKIYMTYDHKK